MTVLERGTQWCLILHDAVWTSAIPTSWIYRPLHSNTQYLLNHDLIPRVCSLWHPSIWVMSVWIYLQIYHVNALKQETAFVSGFMFVACIRSSILYSPSREAHSWVCLWGCVHDIRSVELISGLNYWQIQNLNRQLVRVGTVEGRGGGSRVLWRIFTCLVPSSSHTWRWVAPG